MAFNAAGEGEWSAGSPSDKVVGENARNVDEGCMFIVL